MKEITDVNAWNAFVARQEHASFLQSYEWGAFQNARGYMVRRFGFGNGLLTGTAQAIKYPIISSYHYWQIPQHPSISDSECNECLYELTRNRSTLFVRIEPNTLARNVPLARTADVSPSTTLLLECPNNPEILLAAMHPKTRYNIQLAQRKEVVIEQRYDERAFDLFTDAGNRRHFRTQPKKYYKLFARSFPSGQNERKKNEAFYSLYCARYRDTLIGAILVVFFGDTATYLFGGSAPAHREVMASYALQWRAIQDVCLLGYRFYDFWGIAPTDDASHQWAGITRFKKGFGGIVRTLPGTYDFRARPLLYRLYSCARVIRRKAGGAQNH